MKTKKTPETTPETTWNKARQAWIDAVAASGNLAGDDLEVAKLHALECRVEMLEAGEEYEKHIRDDADPDVRAADLASMIGDVRACMARTQLALAELETARNDLWEHFDGEHLARIVALNGEVQALASLPWFRTQFANAARNRLAGKRKAAGLPMPPPLPIVVAGDAESIAAQLSRFADKQKRPTSKDLERARLEASRARDALEQRLIREQHEQDVAEQIKAERDQWDRRHQHVEPNHTEEIAELQKEHEQRREETLKAMQTMRAKARREAEALAALHKREHG
jgi:hypothetical protein